jgi:hypothetical protein
VPGDKADLKPGVKIFIVAAKKLPDGTLQAARVNYGKDGLTPRGWSGMTHDPMRQADIQRRLSTHLWASARSLSRGTPSNVTRSGWPRRESKSRQALSYHLTGSNRNERRLRVFGSPHP